MKKIIVLLIAMVSFFVTKSFAENCANDSSTVYQISGHSLGAGKCIDALIDSLRQNCNVGSSTTKLQVMMGMRIIFHTEHGWESIVIYPTDVFKASGNCIWLERNGTVFLTYSFERKEGTVEASLHSFAYESETGEIHNGMRDKTVAQIDMPVAHHVIPATTAPVASTASVKSSQMKNLPVYFVKESKSIRTFKDSIMSRLLYEFDLADQRNDVVTEGFINKQAWRYARFFGKGTLPRDCTSMIDKLVEKAFAIDNNNKKCEATLEAQILKDMTPVTAPEFDASKQHEFDNTFYHRPPSIVVSDGGYSLPPPIECKDTLNLANNDTYYVQSEVPEAPTRTALKVYLYGSAYQLINQPIWARSKLK